MTHRERVLAALSHKEPDRVPIDLGGTESSGMTAVTFLNLADRLSITHIPRIFDVYQQICLIPDDVLDRFDIDTVPLVFEPAHWTADTTSDSRSALSPAAWRPDTLADGSRVVRDSSGRVIASMPSGGFYFDPVYSPLAGVTDIAALDGYKEDFDRFDMSAMFDEGLDRMVERARALHEDTSRCVVANLCVHILAAGQILRGFENFTMDLLINEPLACAVMDKLLEAYFPRIDTLASRLRDYVDVVLVNDDLGTQAGPMISPDTYRKMVKPFHARLFAHVKKRFGKPLLMHSCGSIRALIPDLIEIGVDAINPVQVSAVGMDPTRLKKDFGKDITFWGGGCDTQSVLPNGSPQDVRDEVKRRIDTLAPGGGFVFTQVHNIQPGVPSENIIAMLDAAREFGGY